MQRDGTARSLSPDLSPFAEDIRGRLEIGRLASPAEWDRALSRARSGLDEVARRGGDPRFVLMVLASARWRRLRPPGTKFPTWIRLLERVAADEELHARLGHGSEPRVRLREAADDAARFLKSFGWQDQGPFDTSGPSRRRASSRWASRRTDQAVAILAWHLRKGVISHKGYVLLLAELVEAFDLVKSRGGESPPADAVKQRLKRMKGDYYQAFAIPRYRLMFHENHMFLAGSLGDERLKRCGTACPHGAANIQSLRM